MEIRIEKNMESEMETGNYIGDYGSYSLNCRSEKNMVHSRPSRQTNGPKPLNIVKQVSILQRTVHNGGLGKLFTNFNSSSKPGCARIQKHSFSVLVCRVVRLCYLVVSQNRGPQYRP